MSDQPQKSQSPRALYAARPSKTSKHAKRSTRLSRAGLRLRSTPPLEAQAMNDNSISIGNFEAFHELSDRDNFHSSIYESGYDGLLVARCNQNGAHPHQVLAILNGLNSKPASAELVAQYASRISQQDAELERLRREVEWRPIETAPKDGTEILAYGYARCDGSRYANGQHIAWWDAELGWTGRDPDDRVTLHLSHWRPLPPRPELGGE